MRAGDDLQKQRQDIIQDLETKINFLELDVTLVFDAQYQDTESSRSHVDRLEIFFTAVGETADEFILQALKEESRPNQQTVVTSDKKLAWLSRRLFAKTESVEEFISWLNRRYKNKLSERRKKAKLSRSLPKSISTLKSEAKAKISPPPDIQASADECFSFYLDQFEKEFLFIVEKKAQAKENKKSSTPRQKKKSKKSPKPHENALSNELRWQKAFERNLEGDFS